MECKEKEFASDQIASAIHNKPKNNFAWLRKFLVNTNIAIIVEIAADNIPNANSISIEYLDEKVFCR